MPASAPSFLQSAEWQEVQERMGRSTARLKGALMIRHDLPLGYHYWYAPRPALDAGTLGELLAHSRSSGALLLKIDPALPLPSGFPYRPGRSLQPAATIYIDCGLLDEALLAAMHPKTRYNIRLAERHGITVRSVSAPVDEGTLAAFLQLLRDTARRDGFAPHPPAHYRILLDLRSGQFSNVLFLAEFGGQPIGAAIVNCYLPSGTATYLHGASSRPHRSLMAPHLLQWRIIQHVRAAGGLGRYDLGGIDDKLWPGVTRFKASFGGRAHHFPPSADYVFRRPSYLLYRLARRLRRLSP
ncbi:MAG: peptidoglycan bridge formation glycyltransferase FemA/FemB family protein [Candidatus Sungbacteria bacterium]|uniref:Peptidoglycan bridge formation glycyltransferase FemA/FemB family protein n=1 Tax=Candidatus Sungiibacteriota bacterium TaxID=2750080 RepID=A0A932YVD3_9BACT|nr:peptidoglycan bridge formation glycyltransferase FemA/FemB family protein [Candidatus Sungbacteria bacterium]